VQNFRHAQGHRGLAGSRVAGERHVQARRVRQKPQVHAQFVDHQQGCDVADAALDRCESDQIALELVDDRAGPTLGEYFRDRALARAVGGGGMGIGMGVLPVPPVVGMDPL